MAVAKIEVTTQQLIDALGIDVLSVREVVQTEDDRINSRCCLIVDACWAARGEYALIYPLEDVPMRVLAAKE